jgi:hypothetical protein
MSEGPYKVVEQGKYTTVIEGGSVELDWDSDGHREDDVYPHPGEVCDALNAAHRAGAETAKAKIVAFLKTIIDSRPDLCYAADDMHYGFDETKVIEAVADLSITNNE